MREQLTIEDFSDREFLLVMIDSADEEGWTTSASVAAQLDLKGTRLASSRMAWLARFTAVEREHVRDVNGAIRYHRNGKVMHTQRWRPTDLGWAIAQGKLRKGDQSALDRLGDGQMLLVTRWLSERTTASSGLAKLVQREWRYGHARR